MGKEKKRKIQRWYLLFRRSLNPVVRSRFGFESPALIGAACAHS
jgi:hypothetical protein